MFRPRRAFASVAASGALACALFASLGCERKAPERVEPPRGLPPLQPSAQAPLPRAEHAPVDPAGHAAGDPHAAMPPGHPPTPGAHGGGAAADPHGGGGMEALSPGDIPFDERTAIGGVLKLDGKLKDKVAAGDVIYLVVRAPAPAGNGGAPGPVLAVKRLEAATFPMPFQLDSRDAMVVGTQLKAPVVLTARVDKDGDAMTKNPGDLVGTLDVKALPADKLALVLDKVL
jgi:hypothetical protein